MARTFFIRTFGCQMNEHDSERLAGILVADGLEPAEILEDADVVVFNTCCIRENAGNKLFGNLGYVRSLKRKKPGMQVAVTGCLSQMDPEDIQRRADHVDVVVGTHNLASTPGLLRRAVEQGPQMEILDAPDPESSLDAAPALNAVREVPWAAWMTIQTGCNNSCSFCIVPSVRGEEISRPVSDLVDEATMLAGRGVREITLLGQNVNSYGRDITKRQPLFAELLANIGAVEGIERVRYTSPHPKDLRPETIRAMAEVPEVCNQLHLPLQSGSNRVLTAMRRGYTAERYLERLSDARASIDDLAVSTDLIVGFPGESDAEFEETLAVAAEANFDSAYTFIFSPRPGTRAADLSDVFISPEVVADRFERLTTVVERSALEKSMARVGRIEEALVEGRSRRDEMVISGRTRQGKPVHFTTEDREARVPGAFVSVKITRGAPHHLEGEFVELIAPTKTPQRLTLQVR
ncbi:MAG: tRNA (N6-isopentenyl adenosine(37)-C2)-methylthiotransferase MiaB [Actinomycetes bacterium]